jgi:hypothetical protein
MTITLPSWRDFWRWLTLFSYRRWAPPSNAADGGVPVGIPGMRDPEARCEAYAPRPFRAGDFTGCRGDGHYLCRGEGTLRACAHYEPPAADEEEGGDHE